MVSACISPPSIVSRRASDIRKLLYRDRQRERDRFIADRANEYGVITGLFQTDLVPSAAFLAEQHHLAEPAVRFDLDADLRGWCQIKNQFLSGPCPDHVVDAVLSR